MENNQKPEWFELADKDQPVSRLMKKAPKRNFAFILAGILVIPVGAGFALLSHEDQSASALETLNLTQESPTIASSALTHSSNAITMPTTSREDDEEGEDDDYRVPAFSSNASSPTPVSTPAVGSKSPSVIASPSSAPVNDLILPPTKKADDDDDDKKEHKKNSEGKDSKKSENNDDEEDDD